MSHIVLDFFFLALPVVLLIGSILVGRHFLISYLGAQAGRHVFRQRLPMAIAIIGAVAAFTLAVWFLDIPRLLDVTLLIFTIAAWLYVPAHLFRKQRLGEVVVRLPWSKWNTAWVAAGALNVLIAPISAALGGRIEVLHLALFTFGGAFLLLGLNRFELREGGVVALDNILPWRKVTAYRWEHEERCLLKLETTRASAWRTGYLVVPPEKQALVTQLLDRNIRPA